MLDKLKSFEPPNHVSKVLGGKYEIQSWSKIRWIRMYKECERESKKSRDLSN